MTFKQTSLNTDLCVLGKASKDTDTIGSLLEERSDSRVQKTDLLKYLMWQGMKGWLKENEGTIALYLALMWSRESFAKCS